MYLPSLSHWENGNFFSGNLGRVGWHAEPRDAGDGGKELVAELWYWPPCYELATIQRAERFPLTRQGLDDMRAWLEQTLPEMNEAQEGTP